MERVHLKIEAFGKIESADIGLSRMMFLIGDNNSGKSYLLSLVYGLLGMKYSDWLNYYYGGLRRQKGQILEISPQLEALVSRLYEETEFVISESEYEEMIRFLNDFMEFYKERLVKELFGANVTIGRLSFEVPYYPVICSRWMTPLKQEENDRPSPTMVVGYKPDGLHLAMGMESVEMLQSMMNDRNVVLFMVLQQILQHAMDRSMNLKQPVSIAAPVFLPVSRTGFMLTYKNLMAQAIEDQFNPYAVNSKLNMLTQPERHFLSSLSQLNGKQQTEDACRLKIARFIQADLMEGKLELSDMPISDIVYRPAGNPSLQLPLYVSSGVVTELTPVLLHLLYGRECNCMMIEEPEMCLHPELQQKMARTLIQTANTCFPVMATTHSDIMMQHVNNMICLDRHENKEELMQELGYEEDDLLNVENVSVYQFSKIPATGLTEIRELKAGPYGFELPTFVNSLDQIYEHSRRIAEE